MRIGDSIKIKFRNVFLHTIFTARTTEGVKEIITSPIPKSDTMLLFVPCDNVSLRRIDDNHDELTIAFEDYEVKGVMTWKESSDKKGFTLMEFE